jgi:hypothetical protein
MAQITLLDVAKSKGNDAAVGLIEENIPFAPEIGVFPTRAISGSSYKTLIRTGNPTVSFRNANEGIAASKSSWRNALVQCYILSGTINLDRAVGADYEGGMSAYEADETMAVAKQAFIEVANQIWAGVTTDAKGFPGIKAATPFGGATTINSNGSNSTVQSSIYAVRFGVQDVSLVAGNGTTIDLSPFQDQQLYDSGSLPYPGRVASLMAWLGLQIGNANCVGRIMNVGEMGETNDMADDAVIAELLATFPVGYMPSALFMARRSQRQLQIARTVTINSGPGSAKVAGSVEAIAPLPDSAFGIPIYVTDSIGITDAQETS